MLNPHSETSLLKTTCREQILSCKSKSTSVFTALEQLSFCHVFDRAGRREGWGCRPGDRKQLERRAGFVLVRLCLPALGPEACSHLAVREPRPAASAVPTAAFGSKTHRGSSGCRAAIAPARPAETTRRRSRVAAYVPVKPTAERASGPPSRLSPHREAPWVLAEALGRGRAPGAKARGSPQP